MVNRQIYLNAAVLTIILYVLGIFTGFFLYKSQMEETSKELETLRVKLENLQLENMYLTTNQGSLSCKFLSVSLKNLEKKIMEFSKRLPRRLESYEKYGKVNSEYEKLKRDYMLLSLRTWILASSIKDRCGRDIIPILYFYSKDCDTCVKQGEELDKIRSDPRVMIFVVDYNLDEPIVKIIEDSYNVTTVPSLIIDEKLVSGFRNATELRKLIS